MRTEVTGRALAARQEVIREFFRWTEPGRQVLTPDRSNRSSLDLANFAAVMRLFGTSRPDGGKVASAVPTS